MKRMVLSLLAILFFDLSLGFSQIQAIGSPSIINFSRSDYQAGTQNWAIKQDDRGLIYFANNKGVLEFDGTNWQIFSLPNGTVVRSLAFDKNDRLYVGGQDEFGFLEPNDIGQNIYTSLTHYIPDDLQNFEDIWKIFIRPDGIFFCSEKVIFHLRGKKMTVIKPISQRFENFFQLGDKILVQDQEKGLFSLQNDELEAVIQGSIFSNERIVAILPHKQTQSLVFTFSNGLFVMDNAGIRPFIAPANDFLKTNQIYCAIELKDGKYAVGTPQNGLLIMDKDGVPYKHLNEDNGLQNNTVLSIFQDAQQNIWLGLDNGIDYAEINSPFSNIQTKEGISGTGYASIIHQDKIYLGTNQGLFFTQWDRGNAPIEGQKFKPVSNALGQIWNINPVNNSIIVGQHKGASFLRDNQLRSISTVQGSWKFMALNTYPGYAIEGTYAGLSLYKDKNYGSATSLIPDWQLIKTIEGFNESARVFEEDNDGHIWVSHPYRGLFKIDLSEDLQKTEDVTLFSTQNGLIDCLYINVTKIRGELLFTTLNGVFKYEKESDQFTPHQDFTEIFGENRSFHRLIEDSLGNIWFSVDKEFGVLKVKEEGVFNKYEILYFNQLFENLVDGFEHIYAYDESNVFIGSKKGFVHYNPLQDKNIDFPFSVLLRKVISITEGDSVVFNGNATTHTLQDFHYRMNDFRFAFSAPYYEKANYITYRFKLEGFEEDWTKWSSKTEKEYTNLPAGDYLFNVQAKNAYGQTSEAVTFMFVISPPWYWSWYTKTAYLLLGLLCLLGLAKYISKREKKKTEAFKIEQNRKLEQKEVEFKKEVEKSENEIIKLRNEKLHIDINHKNSQLASATMHLVQKSEILMKLKTDLNQVQLEAEPKIKKKIQQISRTIDSDIQLDENWDQFETYFDQVHQNFFKRLRQNFPDLTPKDQKLCAYLRMNLTTKEIAPLLNISVRGVEISRYRLRKKLNLNSEVNLAGYVMEI